ncbi:MAG: hydrolase [Limnobacter sp.]|nr:hydrolase [Limnobacter sp.]
MKYRPPWWMPDGHSQTILSARWVDRPKTKFYRVRWCSPDNDFLDLDFTAPVAGHTSFRTMWVLFHGLEGSSDSHYCQTLMARAVQEQALGVVVHWRGCSGEINRLPRAYHSGDSAEVDWVIKRLRQQLPNLETLNAVGVSVGGNVLLKWLGEQGPEASKWVNAAISVSAPINLHAGASALARGFNRVYTRMFLQTLVPKALLQIRNFPQLGKAEQVQACKNLLEFDDLITAPWHGFAGALDYYQQSSASQFLGGIRVPTLIVHAKNDPFMNGDYLPNPASLPPAVRCVFTEQGGHVGFVSGHGIKPHLNWLPTVCSRFFLNPEEQPQSDA